MELPANWHTGDIVIDGHDGEWAGYATLSVEKKRMTAGLANDSEFLYLTLRLGEQGWLQTLRTGYAIIWIDPEGGAKRDVGIRYAPASLPATDFGRPGATGGGRSRTPPLPGQPESLAVVRRSRDGLLATPVKDQRGLTAAGTMSRGYAVLEMSVPLAAAEGLFGIGAEPGQQIGLVIEFILDRDRLGELARRGQGGITGGGGGGIVPGSGGRTGGTGGRGGRGGITPGAGGAGGQMMPGGSSPKESKVKIRTLLAVPPA